MVKRDSTVKAILRYGALCLILVVMVFPLIWMLRVSLLNAGAGVGLKALVSTGLTLQNYLDLFQRTGTGWYLFNSVMVGVAVTVGNILFCFMVGYTLARRRSLLNKALFVSVIAVLMIPAHIIIIPMYILMVKTGLYDSYWALILPWLVNPIGIFLVKQYVESLPTSMEEAARVDGASEFRILFQVVMPLCKPALAVLAIQVFFTNWNSFLFPYILVSSDRLRTLPVGLALLQGHQAVDWPHLMAGASLAVLPILLLFLILQRQVVSGVTAGAVKQ